MRPLLRWKRCHEARDRGIELMADRIAGRTLGVEIVSKDDLLDAARRARSLEPLLPTALAKVRALAGTPQ